MAKIGKQEQPVSSKDESPTPSLVVPTVTATDLTDYNSQLNKITPLAKRIHVDFSDGEFTPNKTISLIEAHWPQGSIADLHVMYKNPASQLETIISLKPHLVILHAEADGNVASLLNQLQAVGIRAGVALLPETSVASCQELIKLANQVLIFSGKLGFQGGSLQVEVLPKLAAVKAINPDAERAVDGGINATNIAEVVAAGATILNVGGYIQFAADPAAAYAELTRLGEAA